MTRKQKANLIIYSISALLICVGIFMIVRELVLFPSEYIAPATSVDPDAIDVTPDFTLPPDYPAVTPQPVPVTFHFVEREVSCSIIPCGIDSSGAMETVDNAEDATWLSLEPWVAPGEAGNAILAGHVTWAGVKGTFSLLKEVTIGEEVAVSFEGGYARYFEVVSIEEHSYDDTSVMTADVGDEKRLTLITCYGDYNSSLGGSETRVVVICHPISG